MFVLASVFYFKTIGEQRWSVIYCVLSRTCGGIVHPEQCSRDVNCLSFLPLLINSVPRPPFKNALLRYDLHIVKCTNLNSTDQGLFTYVYTYVATTQIKIESIFKSSRKVPGDSFQSLLSSFPIRVNYYFEISHHSLALCF